MRRGVLGLVITAAACSVPEKQPLASDAGSDALLPDADAGDPTDPETTIDEAPPELSATATATFVFRSDAPDATFACRVDGAQPAPCTSPHVLALGDGPHHFSVRALRPGGARDETPAEHAWTIDTVAPDTTVVLAPPAVDNRAVAVFELSSNEADVAFDCALDTEAFAACPHELSLGPLGDGAHSLAARARDRAGNVDASPVIHVWVIDTSPPDTLLIGGPSGTTSERTATFELVSPDAGAGASFECALDGGPFAGCASPLELAGLSDGEHELAVRARDAAGNVDPTPVTRAWIVEPASAP